MIPANDLKHKMKNIFYIFYIFLFGCSYFQKPVYWLTISETPDNNIDTVDVFEIGYEIPTNYIVISDFYIGPSQGNSYEIGTDCGYQSVINKSKNKTIDLGGNAFKITELKKPDAHNTCYRLHGIALKSNQ